MILDAEGLVTSLPRRGVAVAVLSKQDVQEVYGLRSALECQAARRACRMITADDVEYLLSLARDMTRFSLPDDSKLLAAQDLAFHQRILEIGKVPQLRNTLYQFLDPKNLDGLSQGGLPGKRQQEKKMLDSKVELR